MKTSSTLFVLLLLFGFAEFGFSQQLNFRSYSVNDGLPQAQVHDIVQTNDGYIWMATYGGGLAKFDGQQFVTYTTEDGLKDNSVEDVIVDSDDNIWISTSKGGVATFRGDSLVYPFKDDSLYHYALTGFDELEGTMWFGPYQRGAIYQDGDSLMTLTTKDGLPSNTIWDFHKDDQGRVWMGTSKGLAIYDGESFTNYSMENGISGQTVYRILDGKDGKKWLATSNGISIWTGGRFESITSINGNAFGAVYDILRASDGKIWIGTQTNGIYIYDGDDYQHITQNNGLNSNYIYDLYEDHNNNIWIGTDEDGVNLYQGKGLTFYNEQSGLHSNEILSVYQDEEALWLGTTEGLALYDGQKFTPHPLPGNYHNQYVWNITGLPNGDQLVVMPDSTLMRFNGQHYTNFSDQYNLPKLFIYDLFIDSRNHLWICSRSGLYQVSLKTKKVRRYTSEDGLADDRVFYIYEDNKGQKWIGTFFGLNIFDGETFKTVRVDDGLGHNKVHYITQDKKGDIWLGTGGGVSLYEPKANGSSAEIHNFDQENGMELVNTHFIWFDEKGYLWQGTNGGLQMLDVPAYRETGTMQITHHALSKSGIGTEFNYHALTSDNSGEAWMGSMNGVVRLDASQLDRESTPVQLDLQSIRMNSLPVEWQDYQDHLTYQNGALNFPSITFPYGENVYGFTYRALAYNHPENVVYRYKLVGFDKKWMPLTENNTAVYTSLSPGDYTFKVQAKTSGVDFNETNLSYSFSVAYPFWRSYWFLWVGSSCFIWDDIRIHPDSG
jgi:ligand-binding sensor domain-containing protein